MLDSAQSAEFFTRVYYSPRVEKFTLKLLITFVIFLMLQNISMVTHPAVTHPNQTI